MLFFSRVAKMNAGPHANLADVGGRNVVVKRYLFGLAGLLLQIRQNHLS
jgi:hypothetical protein